MAVDKSKKSKVIDLTEKLHEKWNLPDIALEDIICSEFTDSFGYGVKTICARNANLVRLSVDFQGFFRFLDPCPTSSGRVHVCCFIPPEVATLEKLMSETKPPIFGEDFLD